MFFCKLKQWVQFVRITKLTKKAQNDKIIVFYIAFCRPF